MLDFRVLLAHRNKDDPQREQSLLDHLFTVSEIACKIGSELGIENICSLISLLHDLGKASTLFQDYIREKYKGRVNHSSAGAAILDYLAQKVWLGFDIEKVLSSQNKKPAIWGLYKEVLQYPILAHHGLYDVIDSNAEYHTEIRLIDAAEVAEGKNDEILKFFNHLNEEYIKSKGKSIYDLYYEGFLEFLRIRDKLINLSAKIKGRSQDIRKTQQKAMFFYYSSFVRLLLSILKEGDIYDSSNYYREEKDKVYCRDELNQIWDLMAKEVEDLYKVFDNKSEKTPIDLVRTELSDEIYSFSKENGKGAFKLNMPVGSGKTFASLRFSVSNAKIFSKNRVFYTTAFLSVLEQNAQAIKGVFKNADENRFILEHHSNFIEDAVDIGDQGDMNEYGVSEYLKESWEPPFILTTMVQLSNTLFKGRSSNLRRFTKLINSIIIIDEIQSLPEKAIYNFNLMTNFLTEIMNCTVIHSTATQPGFDNNEALEYPCFYGIGSKKTTLTAMRPESDVFKRVKYHSLLGKDFLKKVDTASMVSHLRERLKTDYSALIVLNTKKAVSILYEGLKEEFEGEGIEFVYLTTNQCPSHRLDKINYMKDRLRGLRGGTDVRKLVCVSTKLVEAGVDIDFDTVYRSLAGLDSILQCGGRCNREGEKEDGGNLFIFLYADENLNNLPEIARQREASISALRALFSEDGKENDVNVEKAVDEYFHRLYQNSNNESKRLEFLVDSGGDTILDMLSKNPQGIKNYNNKLGKEPRFVIRQAFKKAADNFELIKEDTISVIARYKNDDLLEELDMAIDNKDYHKTKLLLKKLQPYAIAIRRSKEYESYLSKSSDGRIMILNPENYNEEIGLAKDELKPLIL